MAVQTKMVDKNDQKFFTLLAQLEKDREAENVKFDKIMYTRCQKSQEANVKFDKMMDKLDKNSEESNIKFDRVMSRLEKLSEENWSKN